MITFDLRHVPSTILATIDWRIKFFLNETLDPAYDDPIECESMLSRDGPPLGRDELVFAARLRGCTEIENPWAFTQDKLAEVTAQQLAAENGETTERKGGSGVFTFMLHPVIDCEWRVEMQFINGLYLQDRFMFLRSAVVELVTPQRANVGTSNAFGIVMMSTMQIMLPTNMPLKSFPDTGNSKYYSKNQQTLTQAFLSWLPHDQEFKLHMQHPVQSDDIGGEFSFDADQKRLYFQNEGETMMTHLPYFSNCQGFGRATPLWVILEQLQGCEWENNPKPIGALSFGMEASGDKCNGASLKCILDEVPNFKTMPERWFEAPQGATLFYVTKSSLSGSEMKTVKDPLVNPAYLGTAPDKEKLPRRVLLSFQYWQKTNTEKIMTLSRVYYTDWERPNRFEASGKALWEYTLEVLYFPMSHFEVMVNFAFPLQFYIAIFVLVGMALTAMVYVLYGYHRITTRLARPPKLLDMRFVTVVLPPILKGAFFALVCTIPCLVFGLALVQGEVAGYRFPWAQCIDGQLPASCILGFFDTVGSSYSAETPVTATTPGQRRVGRTGTGLIIMGAYTTMMALKLLVPGRESGYYKREDQTRGSGSTTVGLDDEVGGASGGGGRASGSERGASEADTDHGEKEMEHLIEPIFVTHLWKRSCLALLMYANAVWQQVVVQFSFSEVYKSNVMILLFMLHAFRMLVKLVFTNFMCDTLLVVPVHAVSQVMYLVTLNANPSLFTFLRSYIVVLGIQMIDRCYLSPSEDAVVGKINRSFAHVKKYIAMVQQMRQGPPEDDDDKESDDEAATNGMIEEDEDANDGVDHETEEMMGFCAGLATDAIGDILAPVFFCVCRWQYDESQILASYRVPKEVGWYYILFYLVMLCFQLLINALSINIVELYHGWHVVDYYEFCAYRYETRQMDWKGKELNYDEAVAPHMRALDQMCFSEQFYFVIVLSTMGMLGWLFGMQVVFVNQWNIFDDPATPAILIMLLATTMGAHKMCLTSAGYLKIWVVVRKDIVNPFMDLKFGLDRTAAEAASYMGPGGAIMNRKGLPPLPPQGSVHEGWNEPTPRDAKGMERFRAAFLLENQLWLQSTFSELQDKRIMCQQRDGLLKSLTDLLGEVPPDRYAPQGEDPTDALAFGADPPKAIAIAALEVQRTDFTGSLAQELIRMWRERAQFLLLLQRTSLMVKIDNLSKCNQCELCGNTTALIMTPILTLTSLASQYRLQRDMSPLWNMPLWRHYYQTFTQTCTICSKCYTNYHRKNCNIPVEEKRFRKYKTRSKQAHDLLDESEFGLAILEPDVLKILGYWRSWTQDLGKGQAPRDFLPRYGFEGRTITELRRERMRQEAANAGDDDLPVVEEAPSVPSEPDSADDSDSGLDEEAKKKKRIRRPSQIDLGEEPPGGPFYGVPVEITWSQQALVLHWLQRARQGLQAPQLSGWAHFVPKAPPPIQGGGDGGGGVTNVNVEDLRRPQASVPKRPPMPPPGAGNSG
jgi:hypothetical protein